MLLSVEKTAEFWKLFLSDKLAGNQLITSWATNWAGGVHPTEWEELTTFWVEGLLKLVVGMWKVARIQVMNERGNHEVPTTASAHPEHLRLLIKRLLNALKFCEWIQRDMMTWAEVLCNIITCYWDIGWADPCSNTDWSKKIWKISCRLHSIWDPCQESAPSQDKLIQTYHSRGTTYGKSSSSGNILGSAVQNINSPYAISVKFARRQK